MNNSATKKLSRFAAWRAKQADRLARSSRVFLLGLVVACGVEVFVDWNQTLFEVNVLRDQIRQKGTNYAGLLERAAVQPLMAGDRAALDRLAAGILDDEDAIYVRLTDSSDKPVYEQIDPIFEKGYLKCGKGTFVEHYGHWLERDMRGVLEDPKGFKQRMANSRYRDVAQIWTDLMSKIGSLFSTPTPVLTPRAQIVYQDRLRDENHERDKTISWAIAPLTDHERKLGAVLVAFDMTRTNDAVMAKLVKGVGMIFFFVALIVGQNIISRRDKLRLLDLERRYAVGKQALRDELLQKPISEGGLFLQGALEQAKGSVDGVVWDAAARDGTIEVLMVDPDGDGIDAASVGLHIVRTFRNRRKNGTAAASLDDEVTALGAATLHIPLTRPIGILLLRIEQSGEFSGVLGEFAALQILEKDRNCAVAVEPREGEIPEGIVGPLFRCRGTLAAGTTLLCTCAGEGKRQARLDGDAVAKYFLRGHLSGPAEVLDAAIWARGKITALSENDIAVVTVRRA